MKKLFILLPTLFIFSVFLFIQPAQATSGACSWHGGVNCSLGMQLDGRVYCNDGWKESSTYYNYTEACGNTTFIPSCTTTACPTPYYSGCIDQDDYDTIKKLAMRNGTLNEPYVQNNLTKCANEIIENGKQKQSFEQCLINREETYNDCNQNRFNLLCISYLGSHSYYNESTNDCVCENGYTLDYALGCYKPKSCPLNSTLMDNGSCYCNSGYKLNTAKTGCVIETTINEISCPNNSTKYENKCYCNSGYSYNQETNTCKQVIFTENSSNLNLSTAIKDPNNLQEILSQGIARNTDEENKYSEFLKDDSSEFNVELTNAQSAAITNFITYGISTKTINLGSGERRALIRDYFETVGRGNINWEDIERLVNGEKIVDRNLEKEQAQVTTALRVFKKIFRHDPIFSNPEEDLGWNTLLYRIRFHRDLDKEKNGIIQFKKIFYYSPSTPMDWAAVRLLGYVKQ